MCCSITSGWGAWSVIEDVFCFVEGRWSAEECKLFSINTLESAVQNIGGVAFVRHARSIGVLATHVHTFSDNTSAEHVAERGRTTSDGLNDLNKRRQEWLDETGVHQRTSRVASIYNDIADLLSRGDIDEALRFAIESGLPVLRLPTPADHRDLSSITPTWA
jgi:hypothetical protein